MLNLLRLYVIVVLFSQLADVSRSRVLALTEHCLVSCRKDLVMAEQFRVNDNGFRASKLLLNGGGYLSKQLLLQKAIQMAFITIDEFLADTGTTLKINKLKKKGLINTSQNEILFPINGTPTNLDNWDITLTTLILNNCFKVSKTEKNFIDDLRTHRNTLYGHTSKVEMSDADFANNWCSISDTLTLHSALLTNVSCRTHLQDTIISISKETLSGNESIVTLQRWYEWGIDVEQTLEDKFNNSEIKADERFESSEKRAIERHSFLRENMLRLETDICSLKNLNGGDETKTVDIIKLNRHVAKARNNLQVHGNDLKKLNISYKTSLTEETTLKLTQKKIVVLKGIPGAGKTHLAKNVMMHFLSLYPNVKPLIIRTPRTVEEVLDPNGSFILLVDNFVGKVAFDAMDMKDWQNYIDDFVSQIEVGELYVIITVRTAILTQIDTGVLSHLLKKNNTVDVDESLSFKEKSELITAYATSANITISQDQNDKIVAKKCAGVGFPLLCKMMKGQNVEKLFERPIDFIKMEIKEMQTNNPICYAVLFLTLMQGKNILSKNELAPEQTECFKTLQNYFESSNMDINCIYRAAMSLERTYLRFNYTDFQFEFIHEAIAHSTFLVALEMMPQILAKYCQTEILISNMNLVREFKDDEYDERERNLIGTTCKEMIITKVKEMMSSKNEKLETKCIANARVWDEQSFVDEVMLLFNIDIFYQCDNEGRSLLSYFASIGNKIALETVIEKSYLTHQTTFKTEQMHVALKDACLSGKTECVKYLRSKVPKLNEEVVFAAVRGCVLEIIEGVTSQFGVDKIDRITEKDTGCTILHVASATANVEAVLYICQTWPAIINKVDDKGQNAMHYAAAKGKTECLKRLAEQGINQRAKTNNGSTILHRAACSGNTNVVQFICQTYQNLIQEIDKNGLNAAHYAASNGTVECLKFLIEQGINPIDKTNNGKTIIHRAAFSGNTNVVVFISQTYPNLIQETDKKRFKCRSLCCINGNS